MANPIEQLWRLMFHEPDERQHRAKNGEQRFGRGFVAVAESVAGIAATDWCAVRRNCREALQNKNRITNRQSTVSNESLITNQRSTVLINPGSRRPRSADKPRELLMRAHASVRGGVLNDVELQLSDVLLKRAHTGRRWCWRGSLCRR